MLLMPAVLEVRHRVSNNALWNGWTGHARFHEDPASNIHAAWLLTKTMVLVFFVVSLVPLTELTADVLSSDSIGDSGLLNKGF